jgi:hypothetical protein
MLGFKPKRTNLHEKYDYPTARSITSGENFGDFLIMAPLSIEGASSKGGAVQFFEMEGCTNARQAPCAGVRGLRQSPGKSETPELPLVPSSMGFAHGFR